MGVQQVSSHRDFGGFFFSFSMIYGLVGDYSLYARGINLSETFTRQVLGEGEVDQIEY